MRQRVERGGNGHGSPLEVIVLRLGDRGYGSDTTDRGLHMNAQRSLLAMRHVSRRNALRVNARSADGTRQRVRPA